MPFARGQAIILGVESVSQNSAAAVAGALRSWRGARKSDSLREGSGCRPLPNCGAVKLA